MSLSPNPKSDRSQTLTAVVFMSFFATTVLIFVMAKDIASFVCSYDVFARACSNKQSPQAVTEPGQLVSSTINSACVDTDGLKVSVVLSALLSGEADIQVFTTGEDVFPSEQGMEDSFMMSTAIPTATDQLNFEIPVETMPVGEHIFGNILVKDEGTVSSHVAFFIRVTDCAATSDSTDNPTLATNPDDIPIAYRTTCLPNKNLMIAFEFDKPVFGQYQAFVANQPYQLASVGNQPAILFFSGDAPPKGPIVIQLVSAIDQKIILEETYTPSVCVTD